MALAGGASWAAIGDTGTIQACYDSAGNLKVVSSLPCPRNQTLLEWNREGPKGTDGRNGTNGRDGKDGEDGVSVASVALSKGDDANCPEGGSRFTAVNGVSTYACNGRDGAAGVGSLDALQGAPCNNGAGNAQISYGSNGSISLKCLVTRTLTVATSSTLGADGTVTSAPAGISCPGTCTASFELGTTVTLTATPSGSDAFGGWGGDCAGLAGCTLQMSAARNVTADFAPGNTLHLLMSRTPDCRVTPVGVQCNDFQITTPEGGGLSCKLGPGQNPTAPRPSIADCRWTFVTGTTVTLTSGPLPPLGGSSALPTWGGACGLATGASCELTVDDDVDVTATYP